MIQFKTAVLEINENKKLMDKIVNKLVQQGDCFLWTGAKNLDGAGTFRYKGKSIRIARLFFAFKNKDFDERLVLNNLCGNKSCVNYLHFNPVKSMLRGHIHGFAKRGKHTLEYKSWNAMRQRCNNPMSADYNHYGGRGIVVCERWANFEHFLSDLGNKPSKNHSLDRVDVNGNYEPSNCRWATQSIQMRNRRKKRSKYNIPYIGVVARMAKGIWDGKYISQIKIRGKLKNLGSHSSAVFAACCYDDELIKIDPLAKLNFPNRKIPEEHEQMGFL